MGKVSIKDREGRKERAMTLKSWYQTKVSRLSNDNELINFSKYGPLSSFYHSARVKYGSEYAIKTRSEWNALYKKFLN